MNQRLKTYLFAAIVLVANFPGVAQDIDRTQDLDLLAEHPYIYSYLYNYYYVKDLDTFKFDVDILCGKVYPTIDAMPLPHEYPWKLVSVTSSSPSATKYVDKIAIALESSTYWEDRPDSAIFSCSYSLQFNTDVRSDCYTPSRGFIVTEKAFNQPNPFFYLFKVARLNPDPIIQFPLISGEKWIKTDIIGGATQNPTASNPIHWKWSHPQHRNITYTNQGLVTIQLPQYGTLSCYQIQALGISEAGTTETLAFFNPSIGFVKMIYKTIAGTQLVMELESFKKGLPDQLQAVEAPACRIPDYVRMPWHTNYAAYDSIWLSTEIKRIPLQNKEGKLSTLEEVLQSIQAKAVYLSFWDVNASPCLMEMPLLESIKQRYPAGELEVIAIARETDQAKWQRVSDSLGLGFQHAYLSRFANWQLNGVYLRATVMPCYLLINNRRPLTYMDAARPSSMEWELLKRQIDRILQK